MTSRARRFIIGRSSGAASFTAADIQSNGTDGAWSWWVDPLAVAHGNGRYVSFGMMEGADTDQVVSRIDRSTGLVDATFTVGTAFAKDDHSAPAVSVLPDGRLLTIYTGHGESATLVFRRSTDGSPANFGAEVTALSTSSMTYPQLFVHGSSTLFAIGQTNDTAWDIAKSTDSGDTWTRKKRLWAGSGLGTNQFYQKAGRPSTDVLRFFVVSHPANTQNVLRAYELNLATGAMSDDGGTIGTIEDGTNDTELSTYANLPAIRTPAASRSQRLLDVSEDGSQIIIVDFVAADGTDARYHVGVLTGANYHNSAHWTFREIGLAGTEFYSTSHYFNGAVFDRAASGSIFMARRNVTDALNYMERYSTADAWVTPVLEERFKVSANRLLRPISPRGVTAGTARVLWQDVSSYTDFNTWTMAPYWGPGTPAIVGRSVHASAAALFAAWATQPSARVKDYWNEFYHALATGAVSGGSVLSIPTVLHFSCVHEESAALINVMAPGTNNATKVGAPTFVPWTGWNFDGSDDVIDHTVNINTFGQNSIGMIIGSRESGQIANAGYGWSNGAGNVAVVISPRNGSNNLVWRINSATSDSVSVPQTRGDGLFYGIRDGANASRIRKNRTQADSNADASTTPPNHSPWTGAATAVAFGAVKDYVFGIGSAPTDNQATDIELAIGILAAQLMAEA